MPSPLTSQGRNNNQGLTRWRGTCLTSIHQLHGLEEGICGHPGILGIDTPGALQELQLKIPVSQYK